MQKRLGVPPGVHITTPACYSFEEELDCFQERIGYRFKNQALLAQALTTPCYFGEVACDTAAFTNAALEKKGDKILNALTGVYADYLLRHGHSCAWRLTSFLQSNANLSRVGLALGMHRCVRSKPTSLSGGGAAEAQIRMIADAMEALLEALWVDGGHNALGPFLTRYIFLEPKDSWWMSTILALHSDTPMRTIEAFNKLTYLVPAITIETAAVPKARNTFIARISYAGEVCTVQMQVGQKTLVANAYMRLVKHHPWVVWGFKGPAMLFVPARTTHVVQMVPTDAPQEVCASLAS